ncbi:uncharacterized protein LOC132308431 [Cornus florida]|uniref:uncharacterized protein LOC132308431 n=1 Tax=Cornus florida TaxID=4283 RepID=UPI00289C907A|nr:uncharacterized protein LOC132308431 [Cornus florida]
MGSLNIKDFDSDFKIVKPFYVQFDSRVKMLVHFRIRIRTVAVNNPFCSILSPLRNQDPQICQTLEMGTQAVSKRPMCPSCSKPASLCLCTRLKTPCLENSVRVTILQHSLEKKHPLNSARIATLGLKNLDLVSVSDVHFEARFLIRLLEPECELGSVSSEIERTDACAVQNHKSFDQADGSNSECETMVNSELGPFSDSVSEKNTNFIDNNGECSLRSDLGSERIGQGRWDGTDFEQNSDWLMNNHTTPEAKHELAVKKSFGDMVECMLYSDQVEVVAHENKPLQPCFDPIGAVSKDIDEPAITCTVAKYGATSSFTHRWLQISSQQKPNFDQFLASPVALDALAKGFVVTKLQRKQLKESSDWEECEEFEITVLPGSVLLFPSEKAFGIEALDFEVKNLIVLDGTWAKATRMYNENPWLKLLPHLKLDVEKMSLYSEVRQQPRAGYLSTIESTVYALKAVGDNPEGLDNLLDVFESMVGDQRRCKDERLSKVSQV